jgi:hypothetical protein
MRHLSAKLLKLSLEAGYTVSAIVRVQMIRIARGDNQFFAVFSAIYWVSLVKALMIHMSQSLLRCSPPPL